MYRKLAPLFLLTLLLPLFSAAADERQKAEKQINRISAMAADLTGRRMVNLTLASQLKVKRSELVIERRNNNLAYGSLFLVHQFMAAGAKLPDIMVMVANKKTLYEVGDELHADWKKISAQAKTLNNKIEDNLYDFFLHNKTEKGADPEDAYDALADGVLADKDVSQVDLAAAQETYLFWRTRATAKSDGVLEHNKEQAARQTFDPVRKGGPQVDQVGNTGPAMNTTPH